jgi:hypothetical protein
MLSRLDTLAVLTLNNVPISRALLKTIGRLKTLEELTFFYSGAGKVRSPGARTHEPLFTLQETPFPALRRLVLGYKVNNVVQDALGVLAGVPSLRTIVVGDSDWLNWMLPLINPQLVSFCGNLTSIPVEAFLRFIKGHVALQNLTVFFSSADIQNSYLGIDLDPADLPDLRTFGGPFTLAPKVIGSRLVTKLACPYYMLLDSEPVTILPLLTSTLTNSRYFVYDGPEVWRGSKPIGCIRQLFVRISDASEAILSQIGLCFPNLVHLQLDVPVRIAYSCQYAILAEPAFPSP